MTVWHEEIKKLSEIIRMHKQKHTRFTIGTSFCAIDYTNTLEVFYRWPKDKEKTSKLDVVLYWSLSQMFINVRLKCYFRENDFIIYIDYFIYFN